MFMEYMCVDELPAVGVDAQAGPLVGYVAWVAVVRAGETGEGLRFGAVAHVRWPFVIDEARIPESVEVEGVMGIVGRAR